MGLIRALRSLLQAVLPLVRIVKARLTRGESDSLPSGSSSQGSVALRRSSRRSSGSSPEWDKDFPYQTDPAFSEAHNKEGCYFQAIARIAWEEGGFKSLDLRERIREAAEACREAGYITEHFKVMVPEAVFLVFGLVVEYTDRWEPDSRVTKEGERAALRMRYGLMEHFVVEGGHNVVGWDPWSAKGSKTGRHGYVVDKRAFKIIGRAREVSGRFDG